MPIREDTETYGRKHPVPQNVMDVEFKVVGDLTVRQVMYLFAGGIMVFIFHRSGLPLFWRWFFMIGSGILSLAIAFVPVQERGLDKWVISFIRGVTSPSQRVWRKTYSPPSYFLADYASIIKNEIITLTPAKSRNKLDEFLGQLDHGKSQQDFSETERLKSIQNLYSTPSLSSNKVVPVKPKETDKVNLEDLKENEMASKAEFMEAFDENRKRIRLEQIDRTMYNLPSKMKGEIDINTRHRLPSTIIEESIEDLHKRERELEKKIKEFLALVEKAKREFSKQVKSGAQKENQENRIKFLNEKLEQLNQEKANINASIKQSTEQAKNINIQQPKETFKVEVEKVQKKNKFLENELTKLRQQIEAMSMGNNRYTPGFGRSDSRPVPEDDEESSYIPKAPQRLVKPKAEQVPDEPKRNFSVEQYDSTAKQKLERPEDITELPNVIHGIVKDKNSVLLEEAVIMVKDEKGDVVRALKTNKLGQFKTQTPVNNGKYTVEAIKGGENFDIISIEARGVPLVSLTLIGKK